MEKMFMLEWFHLMKKIFTCIKNIGVWHSFEKNETATMFFLKKPFLVLLGNHFYSIQLLNAITLAQFQSDF